MQRTNKCPLVVAVVLNWNGMTIKYNGRSILDLFLSTLLKTDYNNLKVVIIDSNSTDNSINYMKSHYPSVDILKEKNIRLSYELNIAIKYVSKKYRDVKYILWLNNDLIFTNRNWLKKMMSVAESNKRIGIVGCKLLYPNGKIQHGGMDMGIAPRNKGRGGPDAKNYSSIEEVDGVTGAVMMIRKSAMDKIGIFDEHFNFGFEDVDYCLRARAVGFKIMYVGNSHTVHLEGFTISQETSKEKKYRNFKNMQANYIYYALKHLGKVGIVQVISIELLGSIITIEGRDRERSIRNIKIKDNVCARISVSIKTIFAGYKLYAHYKKYKTLRYNDKRLPVI